MSTITVASQLEEKRETSEMVFDQQFMYDPDLLVIAMGEWKKNPYLNCLK